MAPPPEKNVEGKGKNKKKRGRGKRGEKRGTEREQDPIFPFPFFSLSSFFSRTRSRQPIRVRISVHQLSGASGGVEWRWSGFWS